MSDIELVKRIETIFGLETREREEVRFAVHYAFNFKHGTDGHIRLITIAKLFSEIERLQSTIAVLREELSNDE